jgi:UDP-N-acetylglucosamine diphosphorylase / glucose-1-phosphate thymidylyltransferase / UDP-N-acetylgalactosamine diphosphorylase / glucosamine-1-phosphate N-acetyltransferase / galactosamine-1-phosphate N-acetyltransferase
MIDTFFSLDGFTHASLWQNGEYPWAPLARLEAYLRKMELGQIEISIPSGVHLDHPELISIGKGTVIEPGVFIQGPCVIGKNCAIRHGAYLRGPLLFGDGCVVGHAAEVKHSILLNGAHATHFVYVGDSILGNRVNLAAGVKCANLRLDRNVVCVQYEHQRIDTGLVKLGAIVGDDAQVGCNSVFNPGTLMGRESVSHPLMQLGGYIPPRKQVTKNGIEEIDLKILQKILIRADK